MALTIGIKWWSNTKGFSMKELMFEGSEKKLELLISPTSQPLRNQPDAFWEKLCKKAEAHIVSRFSNSFGDSYILSESSLFVWDHRLLLLTCGRTPLVKALISLIKTFKESDRELLFYQRKNEFFPDGQKSSFRDDLKKINKKIKGQAFCFGAPDEHHFYLFHSDRPNSILPPDRTIEILMYDLDNHIKDLFFKANKAEEIKHRLGLDRLFTSAEVHEHIFKPVGYSLNALMGQKEYYTIHVTPQDPGFYVSFETNKLEENLDHIVQKLVTLFKPLSFDVIVFSSAFKPEELMGPTRWTRSAFFSQNLECGYKVDFYSFFTPFKNARPALGVTPVKTSVTPVKTSVIPVKTGISSWLGTKS